MCKQRKIFQVKDFNLNLFQQNPKKNLKNQLQIHQKIIKNLIFFNFSNAKFRLANIILKRKKRIYKIYKFRQ
jgi:hypothetical protein